MLAYVTSTTDGSYLERIQYHYLSIQRRDEDKIHIPPADGRERIEQEERKRKI